MERKRSSTPLFDQFTDVELEDFVDVSPEVIGVVSTYTGVIFHPTLILRQTDPGVVRRSCLEERQDLES